MLHGYLSMLSYSIPFLTKFPDMKCESHTKDCVDFDSPNTIKNWITHLNLTGSSSFALGLIGSSFFFGYLIGSVTLLRLPDIYGRRVIVLISFACVGVLSLFLFVAHSLNALYLYLIFTGMF